MHALGPATDFAMDAHALFLTVKCLDEITALLADFGRWDCMGGDIFQ
ncbi:MAG: hypothetical protein R3E31_06080 [Chloroflexota bacterium]